MDRSLSLSPRKHVWGLTMGQRTPRMAELLKFAEKLLGQRWIFHGMKRSGNHAVINWILTGGQFLHINNALEREQRNPGHYRFPVPMAREISRKRWRKIKTMQFSWPTSYLVSVEDLPISTQLFDEQGEVTNILLVRDPENLFASRVKKAFLSRNVLYPRKMDADMQRAISRWLEHADELLGTTEHLPNLIGVFFDKWVSDPEYRSLIATRLDISPPKDIIGARARAGGGSSFSGYKTVDASEISDLQSRRTFLNERERALLDEVMAEPRMQETRLRLLTQLGMTDLPQEAVPVSKLESGAHVPVPELAAA